MFRDSVVGQPNLPPRRANIFLPIFLSAQIHQGRSLGILLPQHRHIRQTIIEIKTEPGEKADEEAFKQNRFHGPPTPRELFCSARKSDSAPHFPAIPSAMGFVAGACDLHIRIHRSAPEYADRRWHGDTSAYIAR